MKTGRLERVLSYMKEAALPQIVVSQVESIYYLTGLWVEPGERMLALHITDKGDCTLFANRLFALKECPGAALVLFDDVDDPSALMAQTVKSGVIGIDKFWPSRFTIELLAHRPDLSLRVGSAPVDKARMLKDEEELALLRESSRLNDEAVGSLIRTLAIGQSEKDVAGAYTRIAAGLGGQGMSFEPLVCFGANGAQPHHETGSALLKKGDGVILDLGLDYRRMKSDMTRTVFMGEPTDEQKKVYNIVLQANEAAKKAVRPGVLLRDIDRAARKVIEDAGYGPQFLHRTGHGIGLSTHEPPDCSSACDLPAQPGMVFSIEPGIYLDGNLGVRIEDLVAVTPDGCEVLNHLSRELTVVDA